MSKRKRKARERKMMDGFGIRNRGNKVKYRGRWMSPDECLDLLDGRSTVQRFHDCHFNRRRVIPRLTDEISTNGTFIWDETIKAWVEVVDDGKPSKRHKEPKPQVCRKEMLVSQEDEKIEEDDEKKIETVSYPDWVIKQAKAYVSWLAIKWCLNIDMEVTFVPPQANDQI